jgi:OOP family OmpA-OmpF porin
VQVDSYNGTGVATFSEEVRNEAPNIKSLQPGQKALETGFVPVRVMVDGGYVKVYVNETRVANVPQADLGRAALLRFDFVDVRETPIYLRRIHIAGTDRTLYDRLISDGRVATQGIYFDTGSEQRARAVVAYLGSREKIAAGRLEAAGLGDSRSVADNGTAEGRQQNRRVELVVLR